MQVQHEDDAFLCSPRTASSGRLHGATQSPAEVLSLARVAHGSRMASLARTNQVLDAHLRAHARRASAGRLQFEDAVGGGGGGGAGAPLLGSALMGLGGDVLALGMLDARVDVMLDREGLWAPRGFGVGGASGGGGGGGDARSPSLEAKPPRQRPALLSDMDDWAGDSAGRSDPEGQGSSPSASSDFDSSDGEDADGAGVSGAAAAEAEAEAAEAAAAACPVSIGSEVPAVALPMGTAAAGGSSGAANPPVAQSRPHRTRRMSSGANDPIFALLQLHTARATAAAADQDPGICGGGPGSAVIRTLGPGVASAGPPATAAAAATTDTRTRPPPMRRRSALGASDLTNAWSEAAAAALPGSAVHTLMLTQQYGGGQPAAPQPSQHPLVSPRRQQLPRASAPAGADANAAARGAASLPPSPRRGGAAGALGGGAVTAEAADGARLCFGRADPLPSPPPGVTVAQAWEHQQADWVPRAGVSPGGRTAVARNAMDGERAPPPPLPAASPVPTLAFAASPSPSPPCSPRVATAMGASASCTSAVPPPVAPAARSRILSLSSTHASGGAAVAALPPQAALQPQQRQGGTVWTCDAEATGGQRRRPLEPHVGDAAGAAQQVGEVEEEPLAVVDADVEPTAAAADGPPADVAAASQLQLAQRRTYRAAAPAALSLPAARPTPPELQLRAQAGSPQQQALEPNARRGNTPGRDAHPAHSPSPPPRTGSTITGSAGATWTTAAEAADTAAVAADATAVMTAPPGSPTAAAAPSSPNVRRRLATGSLTLQVVLPGLSSQSPPQPLQPLQPLQPRRHGFSLAGVAPPSMAPASTVPLVVRASDGGASDLPRRRQQLTREPEGGSGDIWAMVDAAASPLASAPCSPGPSAAAAAITAADAEAATAIPAQHSASRLSTPSGDISEAFAKLSEQQRFPVADASPPLDARTKSSSAVPTAAAWRPPAVPAAIARNRSAVPAPQAGFTPLGRDGPGSAPVFPVGAATAAAGADGDEGNTGSSSPPIFPPSRRPQLFRKLWSSTLSGSSSGARHGGILAAAVTGGSSSFTDGTTPIRRRLTAAAAALEVEPLAAATAATAAATMTPTAVRDGGEGGTVAMAVMRSGPAFTGGARLSGSGSLPPSSAAGLALQPSPRHPVHRPPPRSPSGMLQLPAAVSGAAGDATAGKAVAVTVMPSAEAAVTAGSAGALYLPRVAAAAAGATVTEATAAHMLKAEAALTPAAAPVGAAVLPAALQLSSVPAGPVAAPPEEPQEERHGGAEPPVLPAQQQPQPAHSRPLLLLQSSGAGALTPTSSRGMTTSPSPAATTAGPHSPRHHAGLPSTRAQAPALGSTSQRSTQQPAPHAQSNDKHAPKPRALVINGGSDRSSWPAAAEGCSFATATAESDAAPAAPGSSAATAARGGKVARAHTTSIAEEAAAVAAPTRARRFAALSDPQGLYASEPPPPPLPPPAVAVANAAAAAAHGPGYLGQPEQQPQLQTAAADSACVHEAASQYRLAPPRKSRAMQAVVDAPQSQPPQSPPAQQDDAPQPARLMMHDGNGPAEQPGQQQPSAPQPAHPHDSSAASFQEEEGRAAAQLASAVAGGSSRSEHAVGGGGPDTAVASAPLAGLTAGAANAGAEGSSRARRVRIHDTGGADAGGSGPKAAGAIGDEDGSRPAAAHDSSADSSSGGGDDGGSSRARGGERDGSGLAPVGSVSVLARMRRALSMLRSYSSVY
ncbi:hypothetical protein HXX76_000134 [Chlamydomonas incerta]|uniref:Uncharacterized protein n=1 Tax=Chlamydomonas incerta TaxID=51695 RepID=A0A835WDY8_CHLIN|nr:hypothetical protein HXX76_000134 [Chlamydomonas incerta]|eukprot:KAG2445519.1 hypothetical protein HXX76_000134 [Chlamydomonas incerta]